jgi:CubicO group peptidase (beta-lactamase class C family)
VREAFEANFADNGELGARFAFAIDGEIVVDLMGGFADRKRETPFGPDTLTALFSTTKAVAALLIARLVDEGRLAYDQPVADVWPEFAQNGKGEVTIEQALSHQAGLSGFPDETDPSLWFDWDATCAKLAAMAPLFPIGSASGYHPSPTATSPARSSAASTAGPWARRCARTSPGRWAWTCGSACPTASTAVSPT